MSEKRKKSFTCATCGYILEDSGFKEGLPPCPECGDGSNWAATLGGIVNTGGRKPDYEEHTPVDAAAPDCDKDEQPRKEQAKDYDPLKETGFEGVHPPSPEAGDVSQTALGAIPYDKDDEEPCQAKKPRSSEEAPKETGFEGVHPPSPEAGDVSQTAIGTIPPLHYEKVDKPVPGKEDYRCGSCGEEVKVDAYANTLPPCPECGDFSSWMVQIAITSGAPEKSSK